MSSNESEEFVKVLENESEEFIKVLENESEEFVKVLENESGEIVELPVESDGTLLITTLEGQFPNAAGLRYRSSSGLWRGIRICSDALSPPTGGWGCDTVFQITIKKYDSSNTKAKDDIVEATQRQVDLPPPHRSRNNMKAPQFITHNSIKQKTEKRKRRNRGRKEEVGIPPKMSRHGKEIPKFFTHNLRVLDLPVECTKEDLQDYFSTTCGEMFYCKRVGKSTKGLGILRFKTLEGEKAAFTGQHSILESPVTVKFTLGKETKLYVGGIPKETSDKDLRDYFEKFAEVSVKDVYIPQPVEGFAYVNVKFASPFDSGIMLKRQHKMTLCKQGKIWDVQLDVRSLGYIPRSASKKRRAEKNMIEAGRSNVWDGRDGNRDVRNMRDMLNDSNDTRDDIDNRRYSAYNSIDYNYGNDISYSTTSKNMRDILTNEVNYMNDYMDNTRYGGHNCTYVNHGNNTNDAAS